MTALLASEAASARRRPVDKSVPRVPLVREGLRTGEQVQAWKLLYALLLYSGQRRRARAGDRRRRRQGTFVETDERRGAQLGLHDTHYVSTSGVVDVDNYSSAWDLAALTRVAMRNPRFRADRPDPGEARAWAAPTYSKIYVNNNRLLGTYPGANGVKTGYDARRAPASSHPPTGAE